MREDLLNLAEKLGVATKFSDSAANQKEFIVPEKTLEFFAQRLVNKEEVRWQKKLEAIYICEEGNLKIDVVTQKSQSVIINKYQNRPLGIIATHKDYRKVGFEITEKLAVGYHKIEVLIDGHVHNTLLAVAPAKCFENQALQEQKLWGWSIQLYSLKSCKNWGVGDFSDLIALVEIAKRAGANIIGINPINVLMHNYPENASPYNSISRLFINPIYIDVEKVEGFKSEYVDFDLQKLRDLELIDYTGVYNAKIKVLEKIYKNYSSAEFDDYCQKKGRDLEVLAIFQTLYEEYQTWWKEWPDEYKSPNTFAVIEYAKTHAERIGFFKFLQFEADRQFAFVQKAVDAAGLKIGLYRDLAVGVGQDSAEVWSNPDLFISDAGAGAPPDMFNPCGQSWGLSAFNPYILKEYAYQPFIKILRANMTNSGALRIDHVMSLMRLYVLPDSLDIGTYIYYNFDEMLNIVAIESVLNNCTIVGESIGNVPDGFLEKLASKNIHPLSVLWGEKYEYGQGPYKYPYDYPAEGFVSVSTHDMAPLRMWWFGYDIALLRKLRFIDNDADMQKAYYNREEDRWKLLRVLDSTEIWPYDNLRKSNYIYGEGYPEGLDEAVHRFVANTKSKVFLNQLEDILQVENMQNLPGTDKDKHPNWRRKLPIPLEDFEENISYIRNVKAIRLER